MNLSTETFSAFAILIDIFILIVTLNNHEIVLCFPATIQKRSLNPFKIDLTALFIYYLYLITLYYVYSSTKTAAAEKIMWITLIIPML